jgi:type IV fimbrial biogenesis protein FimT
VRLHTDAQSNLGYSLPVLNRSSEVKFRESLESPLTNSDKESVKSLHLLNHIGFSRPVSKQSQKGMTLLEMLITLAIAAIVLTVVAPSVQTIISKNRTTSEINELSAVIQFARFTAIDETSTTVVCPAGNFATCSTNWNEPKIVFLDDNGNGSRDSSEPLLLSTTGISSSNTMTGPNTPISFFDSGATNASVSIKICPNSNDAKLARSININGQGRVRVSIDSNNNDIYEDTNGDELSCS